MDNKNENRRVQMTKAFLKDALLDLLETKSIGKITVSELCEKANVNRGTFYIHYMDVFDLFNQIEDELYKMTMDVIQKYKFPDYALMCSALELVRNNTRLIRILGCENSNYLNKCCLALKERILEYWSNDASADIDDNILDYIFTFTINGTTSLISSWMKNGFREDAGDIAQLIEKICYNGLSILKNN